MSLHQTIFNAIIDVRMKYLLGGFLMFKKGEFIMYSVHGGCVVEEVTEKVVDKISRIYYILKPLGDLNSTIMIPVDNDKVKMRAVISKEEAESILDSIDSLEYNWISDRKLRNEDLRQVIKIGDPVELTKIVKTLVLKSKECKEEGRKFIATDTRALADAEKLLFSEFSISLGVDVEDVEKILLEKIDCCSLR